MIKALWPEEMRVGSLTLLSRLEDSESFSARFDKSHPVRLSAWSTAKLAMQANGSVSFRYFRKCFQKLETQLMVLEAPTFLLLILFNLVLLSFNSSVLILLQVRGFDLQSTPSRFFSYCSFSWSWSFSFNSSVLISLQVKGFDLQSTLSRYHSSPLFTTDHFL